MSFAVAIDGPSGAGKSSLAKKIAKHYRFLYIDTGAMYRSVGLYALRNGVNPKEHEKVVPLLKQINLELKHQDAEQLIFLNGEDVSKEIRKEEVGMAAAGVSACSEVRAFLLQWQRDLAQKADVIMDGRDIGTVVLPNADVKIFLTASAEVRAHRRHLELIEKGEKTDYETVLSDVKQRDYDDTHREQAPLKQAPDAVLVDTSDCGFDQAFERLCAVIEQKRKVG